MSWKDKAIQKIEENVDQWIDEIVTLASIPAPSHDEGDRGTYVSQRLQELGYDEVTVDDVGNVMVEVPGDSPGPSIMLVAHIDTVFDRSVHTPARLDGSLLRGPSVGDNSAAVVALLALARLLKEFHPAFPGCLILAMSVGEEGLGNLKGIRALMDRPQVPDIVLAIDGRLGTVVTEAIASQRLEVKVKTAGGHSWKDFGNENAIAIASKCIAELTSITLPSDPKTVLNVGTFHGGISVNSIAEEATFTLDLRSADQQTLDDLSGRVRTILDRVNEAIEGEITYHVLGERPGGKLAPDHWLIDVMRDVLEEMDIQPTFAASSTDANIPLSLGVPAVAFGVCRFANAHRTDEYLEVESVPTGIKHLVSVVDSLWNHYKSSSAPGATDR